MGTVATVFNRAVTADQVLSRTAALPMDGSTNGTNGANGTSGASGSSDSGGSGGDSSTISANDFLTLLVTEMQNQDPTADTDPNEYINQLVQVNSLEQLIDINQTLSGDVGGASSSSSSGSSAQVSAAPNGSATTSPLIGAAAANRSGVMPAFSAVSSAQIDTSDRAASRAPGNLALPSANAAAQKVGRALDGRGHMKDAKGSAIALQ